MITLDKITITAPLGCITILNDDSFTKHITAGVIDTLTYNQKNPYYLFIKLDQNKNEVLLVFTGKVLMDEYPRLISKETIRMCFSNIENLGICTFDVDKILSEGVVSEIDVTKDIPVPDCKATNEYLRTHLRNHKKYVAEYRGKNLVIDHPVKTKEYKVRLSAYDKYYELQLSGNKEFLFHLEDAPALLEYYKGKVRFELNLKSAKAIIHRLGIPDNAIMSVLNSETNPILDFIDDVIVEDESVSVCSSIQERKNLAFLRDCKMDIQSVEAELRHYCSKGTHIAQVIKPYRRLLEKIRGDGEPMRLKKALVDALLMEIFIVLLPFSLI